MPLRGLGGLKVLALVLVFVNLVLWYAAPWLRDVFDAMTGRLASPRRPMALNGVQELLVYYDPWLACYVFPFVYTLGFIMIAFLFRPAPDFAGTGFGAAVLAVLLVIFESIWISLIVFAILFRGPEWNFYWPWEAWTPKLVPLNTVNFSEVFWYVSNLRIANASWTVREAPGLILAAGYLCVGLLFARSLSRGTSYFPAACSFVVLMLFALAPLLLRKMLAPAFDDFAVKRLIFLLLITGLVVLATYMLFRLMRAWCRFRVAGRPMVYWRCALVVFLVQLAALLPAKVLLHAVFGLKYFLHFPKYWVNV
jgi:hypothetical protein